MKIHQGLQRVFNGFRGALCSCFLVFASQGFVPKGSGRFRVQGLGFRV